ncbi:MAG TPA: prephenate dehydrogenase/arogenate dehydrogenase family protein [Anaerolineaceae bacterium]|jgi:prephenate dehydrogenase
MTLQISIIGLNQIGASIGLALGSHKDLVRRVGSDGDPAAMRRAEKLGAIDAISYNFSAAARQADLVVLDVAVDDLEETLKAIGQDLKEGVVVIDTSPVKIAAAEWAKKILPEGQSFVAWTPAINPIYLREPNVGLDAVHADLFQNSLIYITAPLGIRAEALKLASDLVSLVGATPMFADPYEVDGLIAANHHLPGLAAAGLMNTLLDQPGWREGKRLAGKTLAEATAPILHLDEREALGQSILLNKDNVLRLLDNYIATLLSLRDLIASQNSKDLTSQLKHAIEGQQGWLKERKEAPWLSSGKSSPVDVPSAGEMWGRLIGLGGGKKKKR